jgi:5-deoxy-D-glucuronate isomerase
MTDVGQVFKTALARPSTPPVPPSEVPMEEVCYFQVEPKQGFGFMRIYTDPADPSLSTKPIR